MSLETLLLRLEGVRANGVSWKALCPAHDDHNPSLSIREANGKVLLRCHAGCLTEDICAALGIKLSDLFSNEGPNQQIEAIYGYVNEANNPLFEVVRYVPKGFRQRRSDGRGGWIWNLDSVRRVLYRLPEVLTADTLLVCEGEKDCESARRLGLVATCNPGGAGKWRGEYSAALRGKHVCIIKDADEPGRKHAEQVAQSLHSKAKSVKAFELAGAKDLTEWVGKGGSRESLIELIRNAPEWKAAEMLGGDKTTVQGEFHLTSLRDLMLEPEERISWLLADKLPTAGLSVLCAKPKVGKSTFARCLSLAVATGEPFLDCATMKGPVIYLALEEKRSEIRRHFADLGATGEEDIHIHAASAPREAVLELYELTKQIHPVLIVIDPLFKLVRIRDEKAYAEVCSAIEPLLILARDSGAHVLLSHHSGKMERADATDSILGSTAIFGGVDTAIIIKKTDQYRTIQSCQRYGTDWPELVLNFEPSERSISLGVERSEVEAGRMSKAIVAYLSGCDEPQTRVQIEARVEGKTKHKRAALKALCSGGRLSESGAGTKGDPFRYVLNQSADSQPGNEPKPFVNSSSHIYAGTREQQSENGAEPRVNTDDILVPAVSRESEIDANSGEQAFWEGKLKGAQVQHKSIFDTPDDEVRL